MKSFRFFYIFLPALVLLISTPDSFGKKIKQSLKVTTEKAHKKNINVADTAKENIITLDVCDSDTVSFLYDSIPHTLVTSHIRFAGYDKTVTASKESFHAINETPFDIKGMTIRIIYKDMKGRMLHSRDVRIEKEISHDETRKIDIPSWDVQKSFYYYLSNEPKRTAAPYKVTITPIAVQLAITC